MSITKIENIADTYNAPAALILLRQAAAKAQADLRTLKENARMMTPRAWDRAEQDAHHALRVARIDAHDVQQDAEEEINPRLKALGLRLEHRGQFGWRCVSI